MPGRSTKEKGREVGKVDGGEGRIRNEIAQEVLAGIKEKASAQDDAKAAAQRTAGQSVMQSWDCSQIENEEEEEEEPWQKKTIWNCNWRKMRSRRRVWSKEEWNDVFL